MSLETIVFLTVVVISVVADLVTKRRKAEREREPQGSAGTRPQGEMPAEPARKREARQSAQVLLPDDLWAILTGESRPQEPEPVPTGALEEEVEEYDPAKESGYHPDYAEWDDYETDESASGTRWAGEGESAIYEPEPYTSAEDIYYPPEPRPIVTRPEREIISLEAEVMTDSERHAAFHERLASTTRPRHTRRRKAPALNVKRSSLRRAIVLKEILGPPRGLEDRF